MTAPTRSRLLWWALAAAIIVAGLLPVLLQQLVWADAEHWQVDLGVYREAGISNLYGRPVYEVFAPPQLLPFTYPPIASILAIPLALVPFTVAGWCWFLVQAAADVALAAYAVRPLLRRCGRWAPVVLALAAVTTFYLLPVHDGLRFGQVDVFLVLAVLLDLHRPHWWRRVPAGVLIGLATAIKLTPGMFIVHLLVTGRRREAGRAIATAVGATLVGFVLLPHASFAYWGEALLDSSRLGPNDGTSNQSLRGMLLRLGPGGSTETVLWLVLVAAVLVVGLGLARTAYRRGLEAHQEAPAGHRGDVRLQVALVGMVTVLVSPVSWIHHFAWVVLVIGALIGSGRDLRRVVAGLVVCVVFILHLPWWGQWTLVATGEDFPADSNGNPWGLLMNNAYGLMALVCLGLLAWSMRRSPVS